jgi:uracil-DNA glycosylase family 4
MDRKAQLREFLRQRLEAGETEIVLERMTADQAIAALRQIGRDRASVEAGWRETLRAAAAPGAAPLPREREVKLEVANAAARVSSAEPATPAWVPPVKESGDTSSVPPMRAGLSVGTDEADLFVGPMGDLQTLGQIEAAVATCTRCPLHQTAKNPVPGQGAADAGLVIVGEAPGASEDESGLAFVGPAGQLLTKILSAVNLSREEVFICNVLKHRPPLNRNPVPQEVQACTPYLLRQIELIHPKVILALGTFAAQTLLQTNQTIGNLRGLVHRYYGTPLVVTYHPAALLRNPGWKRPTWEDVKLVRRILDSAIVGA